MTLKQIRRRIANALFDYKQSGSSAGHQLHEAMTQLLKDSGPRKGTRRPGVYRSPEEFEKPDPALRRDR